MATIGRRRKLHGRTARVNRGGVSFVRQRRRGGKAPPSSLAAEVRSDGCQCGPTLAATIRPWWCPRRNVPRHIVALVRARLDPTAIKDTSGRLVVLRGRSVQRLRALDQQLLGRPEQLLAACADVARIVAIPVMPQRAEQLALHHV